VPLATMFGILGLHHFWSPVGLLFSIVGLVFYFLPTIVAAVRASSRFGWVLLVNFLLGWSLVGWVVALVMALAVPRSRRH